MQQNRNKKKKTKVAFLIIGCAVVISAVIFVVVRQKRDLTHLSLKVNEVVRSELVDIGFTDIDLVREYGEEMEYGRHTWVAVHRILRVDEKKSIDDIVERLKAAIAKLDMKIIFSGIHGGQYVIRIGKDSMVMNTVILRAPAFISRRKAAHRLAIVIDDVSQRRWARLTDLDIPLTFAILPDRRSFSAAKELRSLGYEIILHQPMQPESYPEDNPGPGAILTGMKDEEIRMILTQNLTSVPGAVGINNHMGSRIMKDAKMLEVILKVVRDRGLIFLDSRTCPDSPAGGIARELGVPFLENEVFLDNEDDFDYIRERLEKAASIALKHGTCVAIGHVQRKNIALAISSVIDDFRSRGIEFVYLSDMVDFTTVYSDY